LIGIYEVLAARIEQLRSETPEIEIEETRGKIKIPLGALKLLANILKEAAAGNLVSIVPVATEVTTQAAAEILGCSRPHVVKLFDEGKMNYTKVGKHRRIKFDDLMVYKKDMKTHQKNMMIEVMRADEDSGLYDT